MRIPIVNRKGGVAKSTTAINLGAALPRAAELGIASRGYRTLIVDMDPQASTSFALTLGAEDEGPHLGHVLLEGMHVEEAIRTTTTPGLHLITACEALGEEKELVRLAGVPGFPSRLREALAMLETPFDVVLFDCPPGIGLPMTLAMIAGERFIIPTSSSASRCTAPGGSSASWSGCSRCGPRSPSRWRTSWAWCSQT